MYGNSHKRGFDRVPQAPFFVVCKAELWGTSSFETTNSHDMPNLDSSLYLADWQVSSKVTKALAKAALVEAKASAMWLPQKFQLVSVNKSIIVFFHIK